MRNKHFEDLKIEVEGYMTGLLAFTGGRYQLAENESDIVFDYGLMGSMNLL